MTGRAKKLKLNKKNININRKLKINNNLKLKKGSWNFQFHGRSRDIEFGSIVWALYDIRIIKMEAKVL